MNLRKDHYWNQRYWNEFREHFANTQALSSSAAGLTAGLPVRKTVTLGYLSCRGVGFSEESVILSCAFRSSYGSRRHFDRGSGEFEAVPFKTISVMGDGPNRCSRCEGLKSASPLGRRPMAYFVTFSLNCCVTSNGRKLGSLASLCE